MIPFVALAVAVRIAELSGGWLVQLLVGARGGEHRGRRVAERGSWVAPGIAAEAAFLLATSVARVPACVTRVAGVRLPPLGAWSRGACFPRAAPAFAGWPVATGAGPAGPGSDESAVGRGAGGEASGARGGLAEGGGAGALAPT